MSAAAVALTAKPAPAASGWPIIGYMPMPLGFRHASVLRRGRPRHGTPGKLGSYDSFYIKHPPMDHVQRAKLFAPFDALAGFSQCISAKQVVYEERRSLTEGEREELDKRAAVLSHLTRNSRVARENAVRVSITYFSPCADVHSEWYSEDGRMGQYKTLDGVVLKVDTVHRRIHLITADEELSIPVDDIVDITGDVFRERVQESA